MTTADTEDASFSGDVSLVLRGTSGATTYGIPLTSAGRGGKSPFAAGSKAEFRVRAADVWPLESATVSMVTGPNSGSSWRPLKLEVRAGGCTGGLRRRSRGRGGVGVWPLGSATVPIVTGPNSGSSWRPLKLEVRSGDAPGGRRRSRRGAEVRGGAERRGVVASRDGGGGGGGEWQQ